MAAKNNGKKEGVLTDYRKRKIAYYSWIPQNPLFQVVLVHGFSEHSRMYFSAAEAMFEQNIAVHMMDLPGHGKSGGAKGHQECFQDLVDQIDWFMTANRYILNQNQTFLIGHSMGGLLSALYSIKHQRKLSGLILSSPLTGFSVLNSVLRFTLAHALFFRDPYKPFPTGFHPKHLCRDRTKWVDYYRDPLRIHSMSPHFYLAMTQKFHDLKRFAEKISLPVLMFQGAKDITVSPHGTQELFHRIASTDKTLINFSHAVHELFQEEEREIVIPKIIDWMKIRA